MDDLKCNNCNAEFYVETIEESEESETPQYCPFCGSEDIRNAADEDEDQDEDYMDESEDEEDFNYDEEE